MLSWTGAFASEAGWRSSRKSHRIAVGALLYREAVVLLALWLALAIPMVCQHGPMRLFHQGDQGSQAGHGGYLGHGSAGHAGGAASLTLALPDEAPPPAAADDRRPCCLPLYHEIHPLAAAAVTMAFGVFVNVMPPQFDLPSASLGLPLGAAGFAMRRQPALPPSDPPPRP